MTILDTYNYNGLTYEDYLEFCEINEIEPEGEDSRDFYEWLGHENDIAWEDLEANLSYSKVSGPVSVCGHLGLWWGNPTIQPEKFDNLWDAIMACARDAWDVIITLDKGVLKVQALHHDGRNVFTIHREHGYFWPKYLF